MELRSIDFAQLTWPEIRMAVDNNVGIILPVGSTEQHGPHLPLQTDTLLAHDLAMAVAAQTNMVVAPTISYGYRSRPGTGGGQGFVGTTSLRGETLMRLVEDVISEFIRHGFKRIVLLNWHMENHNFIYESAYQAVRHLNAAEAPRIMIFESAFDTLSSDVMDVLFPHEFPGWGTEHASIFETSIMLHLHPKLVLWENVKDDEAEKRTWYDIVPIPHHFVAPSGILWKASQATAEKGRMAWDDIVGKVRTAVLEELGQPTGRVAEKSV